MTYVISTFRVGKLRQEITEGRDFRGLTPRSGILWKHALVNSQISTIESQEEIGKAFQCGKHTHFVAL
jgi:hypothetical protein